jgi:hypothetical protein
VNPRATIALFVVTLLVVGGLVYLRSAFDPTRDAAENRRYAAIFEPGDITEIDMVRDGETVSLRRAGGGWQLTAPVADRADPAAVDRLLLAARFLDVRDRQATKDPDAMPESGLATPRVRIDLRGADDIRLDLGGATALPGEIFARVGGQPHVLRVPDDILGQATVPVDKLRDPRLTDLSADDIEKFTVQRADGEMTVRLERGRWMVEKPVQAPADPRAVRDFLERMLGLAVTSFPATGTGARPDPLPGQAARLAVTPRGGGEEIALDLRREPGRDSFTVGFEPRGGTLGVDPAAALLFDISPEMLRDRSLGYVDPDTIDRIVIEADGHSVSVVRRGEEWITADGQRVIGRDGVEEFVALFNETRVASFATAAPAGESGLDRPGLRLRFFAWLSENTAEEAAGGHLLAGADFGSTATDGNVYARVEGSEEKVTVPPELEARVRELAGVPPAPPATPAPPPAVSPEG